MSLKDLLNKGKIEEVEKSDLDFARVESDLSASADNIGAGNYEWGLSIGYHAVLRAGMGLMNSLGYRVRGNEHHKSVFLFLASFEELNVLAKYFDRIRRKRNEFIYRGFDEVSEREADEVLVKAKGFVLIIRTFVSKKGTEVKDE